MCPDYPYKDTLLLNYYWSSSLLEPCKELKIVSVFPAAFFIEFCVLHLLEGGLVFHGNVSMGDREVEVRIATQILPLSSASIWIPIAMALLLPTPTRIPAESMVLL